MKFTKIFISYFFKYLLAFVFIYIFALIMFFVSKNNIQTYILNQSDIELQDGIQSLNESLDKMTLTSQTIYQNNDFPRLILLRNDTADHVVSQSLMKLKTINDQFSKTCYLHRDVAHAFILFRNNDLYLSKSQCSLSFNDYYGDLLFIDIPDTELADTNTLKQHLFQSYDNKIFFIPVRSITYTDNTEHKIENAILYLVNGSTTHAYSGHIFCYVLSKDTIINYLFPSKFVGNGFIHIRDAATGKELFSHGDIPDAIELSDTSFHADTLQDYYVKQAIDKTTNWHITLGISASYIDQQIASAQNLLLIYLAVGLVSVFILAFYFSISRYHGFKQTISAIEADEITKPQQNHISDYNILIHNITQLAESKRSYRSQLDELENLNQSILLENLITRGAFSEKELQGFEKCFDHKPDFYCVATVRSFFADSGTNSIEAELAMKNYLISQKITLFGSVHSGVSDHLFLIELSPFQKPHTQHLIPVFEDMAATISEAFNCTLHIGISTVNTGLSNVHKCYEQTIKIIQTQYTRENENVVLTYDYIANSITENPITLETLTHLYNFVICGQYTNAANELTRLENFYKKMPYVYEKHNEQLFYSLQNLFHTIIISLNCKNLEIRLPQFSSSLTCPEIVSEYKNFASCIYDHISQEKKSHNDKLKDSILEIIHEKYDDCMLSAYSISKEVGISEDYLLKFFREQTGKSFSSYLLWFRIENAKEYLKTGNYTNNEIAALTGFSCANTFYRNFQKITGMTPKNYKEGFTERTTNDFDM